MNKADIDFGINPPMMTQAVSSARGSGGWQQRGEVVSKLGQDLGSFRQRLVGRVKSTGMRQPSTLVSSGCWIHGQVISSI